ANRHSGTHRRAERTGKGVHVVQLVGREKRWMEEGARFATDSGADLIDINMGCPARKVINGYAGAALMRDVERALGLIEATIKAAGVPVTLKMRLGWDAQSLNAADIARRAEDAGIAMITVHGRTRCQFYKGRADWQAIRSVREAVTVPVVANGDLTAVEDAPTMLAESGADAVMIGRGAYGRPWFPGSVVNTVKTGRPVPEPQGAELADRLIELYDHMLRFYGREHGVRLARKHLAWALDRLDYACAGLHEMRRAIVRSEDPAAVVRMVRTLTTGTEEACAA
ncbi:MAG: tRNA-dihydrouridine synthase, partial [Hyphomicrobiales bacterium]|nr:tRNA-dihydrouridine synthase [Hyphomicrobiales bacterium]